MDWFDAAAFVLVTQCFIIGVFKGLLRTVPKIGASVFATVFENLLSGRIGLFMLPKVIKGDSVPARALSEQKLKTINDTHKKTIGVVLLFLILFIIFRIIEGFVSKALRKNDGTRLPCGCI